MRIKSLFVLALLVSSVGLLAAQTDNTDSWLRLYYQDVNYIYNPFVNMNTPIKMSYNTVNNAGVASLGYSIMDGEYRSVESSQKIASTEFDIDGLKKIGKFSFEGGLNYDNFAEQESAWAGTYMLSEHNPFKLGAESGGDRTIEEYNLYGGASYDFEKLSLAFRLGYNTASVYDHSDPRVEINSMRFKMEPALMYAFKDNLKVGASAKVEFFNSSLIHTLVNNYEDHNYYLMMGCGDFYLSSTGLSTSYPRDYMGHDYSASLQVLAGTATSKLKNATEITYSKVEETAQDGQSAAVFMGGDYYSNRISVSNRTTMGGSGSLVSNIDLGLSIDSDEGYWYDQKKVVNTDQGNLVTYEILQRYKLYTATIITANAAYQLDIVKDKLPQYTFAVDAEYTSVDKKSNDGSIYSETYANVDMGASAKKFWYLKNTVIDFGINFRLKQTMDTPVYQGPSTDISDAYTYPYIAYLFSDNMLLGAEAKATHKFQLVGRSMLAGLSLKGYLQNPMGENDYYDFEGTNRSFVRAQVFLNF